MIEGGLDTLDKVEAGEFDADDVLEFGVKIGEEKTEVLNRGVVKLLLLMPPETLLLLVLLVMLVVDGNVAVGVVEDDKLVMTVGDDDEGEKPVVAIGMSRKPLALGVCSLPS